MKTQTDTTCESCPPYPNRIVAPNAFIYLPPRPRLHSKVPTIVFFITGNPGLISYYHEFLGRLCQQRQTPSENDDLAPAGDADNSHSSTNRIGDHCVIAGFSLGGFELSGLESSSSNSSATASATASTMIPTTTSTPSSPVQWTSEDINQLSYPPDATRKALYTLHDQIQLCYARLTALVAKVRKTYDSVLTGQDGFVSEVNVILAGHSVGAYIAMELVRLHHAYTNNPPMVQMISNTTAENPSGGNNPEDNTTLLSTTKHTKISFSIRYNILLTPTIIDIAHSPSGRIATPLLSYLPFLPTLLQLGSNSLSTLVSETRLKWLISKITGMKQGSEALAATTAFIMCPGAVRQALSMARDEMVCIGEDIWREEVWGGVKWLETQAGNQDEGVVEGKDEGERKEEKEEKWKPPKLYFWFAREDHWVAGVTREKIVAVIQQRFGDGLHEEENGKVWTHRPEIVIDESEGLVHAWCIEQSELVASRVQGWIEEVLDRQ